MHTTVAAINETDKERAQRFSDWYENHIYFQEQEPTVITVHQIYWKYGGPEEGGWYYAEGWPIENVCIFSKEQAIQELIRLHTKYEQEEYQYWDVEHDINLASSYAEFYPKHKPHYE